jgi:catechol 2,3-dioxygenase-like lactoylglutathione lyase family enzyme
MQSYFGIGMRASANDCHRKEEAEDIDMKRFHVHVHVGDLDSSVRFYSTLFGEQPVVIKTDYAKWMLEDPRVNFAITSGASKPQIDHLGLQVESGEDLTTIGSRLKAAGEAVREQVNATCCYAKGDKGWVNDPDGISWETFHTCGESTVFGNDVMPRVAAAPQQAAESCCASAAAPAAVSCCGTSKAE